MIGVALRDAGSTISDLSALARAADDIGYSHVWIPEVGSRDALVLSATIGSRLPKATIGTGVIPVFSRGPVALALGASAASEAANGRFILGLGAGHRTTAEHWFGATWKHPRGRLRETVEVLRRILTGERVTHHGEIEVEDFHLRSSPPRVPIYLAALTPASLRLAGEVADGVILNWLPSDAMERSSLVAREAAADANREIRVSGYIRCAVVEDEEQRAEAWKAAREHTYSYIHLPSYATALSNTSLSSALEAVDGGDERALDSLTGALCVIGDAKTVRDTVEGYRDAGVDLPVVYPVPYGTDRAMSVLRTLRAAAARAEAA